MMRLFYLVRPGFGVGEHPGGIGDQMLIEGVEGSRSTRVEEQGPLGTGLASDLIKVLRDADQEVRCLDATPQMWALVVLVVEP